MKLILASQSAARRAMLAAAGIDHEAVAPGVDEEAAKASLRADGLDARALADALAELKARKLSARHPADLVLGCDQILVLDNGAMLDKAAGREDLRAQLAMLHGQSHRLISAAVICEAGVPVWRHIDSARLFVRDFSDAFLDAYLAAEWPDVQGCVGGYRLEGAGVQLFSRIEGSHFTILGMPLLVVLDYLRIRGVIAT